MIMTTKILAAAVLAVSCTTALADGHVYPISDPAYKAECSSCHIAYPPQLLPAESWKKLMSGLNRHFGTDASVDAKAAAGIGRYLEQNASGRASAPAGAEPRISEMAWFSKEHRKVPTAVWKSAAVKSPSNCAGCHTRAESGDFSERTLRVPR
jgi:hypothetical protein